MTGRHTREIISDLNFLKSRRVRSVLLPKKLKMRLIPSYFLDIPWVLPKVMNGIWRAVKFARIVAGLRRRRNPGKLLRVNSQVGL